MLQKLLPPKGSRIIVRSPNWLGDAVMVMPAVAELVKHYRVDVLVPAKLADVWKVVEGVEAVHSTCSSVWKTYLSVKNQAYDGAVIFPNSLRTALEVLSVPHRLGFTGHFRSALLSQVVERRTEKRHQALDYLDLVSNWGLQPSNSCQLPSPKIVRDSPISEPYIALCPGAEYGPAKRWIHFDQVAQVLKSHAKIVILGAKGDADSASIVENALGGDCLNLTGKTTLSEFIRWIAHAKLLICNDSGSMHLAALTRTPSVAIFGSTEPSLTGPLDPCVRVLRHKVDCSPCFLRECPIDFRCMKGITAEAVLAQASELLAH